MGSAKGITDAHRRAIVEWQKCQSSCSYFLNNYGHIYDATLGDWVPFALWPDQERALRDIVENRLTIVLKARQLGLTWLCLGVALWKMLFHPAATALLFSRREEEASMLVNRLRGMYKRIQNIEIAGEMTLPSPAKVTTDNTLVWELSNGSLAHGFPTTAGDSYTATYAMVDEADLVPDLDTLMNAVKPTIDGGGQMVLLSRSDKDRPSSPFKKMFVAANKGLSPWKAVFIPWYARPSRTQAWYEEQKADVMGRTGSLDDLYQQYPSTPEEALMARTLDKRLPHEWLTGVYKPLPPIDLDELPDAPAIVGLEIYVEPKPQGQYVITGDPAEGNPTSDPSAMCVLDADTGEEVAAYADQVQPTVFADYVTQVSEYYNDAPAMIERNNHGHTVIAWLLDNTTVTVMPGWDGRPGWLTNTRGKADMWTKVAESIRPRVETVVIHSDETYLQLVSIEGATLRAPEGLHDDRAMAFGLAAAALEQVSFYGMGGIHV